MSYLCLTGTWASIFAENRLKDSFLLNFIVWGLQLGFDSLDNFGVLSALSPEWLGVW